MDVITSLSFGTSVEAMKTGILEQEEPKVKERGEEEVEPFQAPILLAMDASLPVFVRFKYSEWYRDMILKCPPKLSKILSPATAGLVDLQQVRLLAIGSISRRLFKKMCRLE